MKEERTIYQEMMGEVRLSRYQQQGQGMSPLVWTEVFLREISRQPQEAILHFWPMEKTVILGLMDRQVPHFDRGIQMIKDHGYQPLVRSMGGLGVVADRGILNVSLVLPNTRGHKFDFHRSYLLMVDVIRQSVRDLTDQIEAYEIKDSYCPGTYDLSIGGRKFAGLAQRMYQGAIVVSAYLSLTGHQEKRGQLMADFYHQGFAGQMRTDRYPQVNPASMANLSTLLGKEISVKEMQSRIEAVLVEQGYPISDFQIREQTIADCMMLQEDMQKKAEKDGL